MRIPKSENERAARIIVGQMKFQKHQSGNTLRGMWIGFCCAAYFMNHKIAKKALKRVQRLTGLKLPRNCKINDIDRINQLVRDAFGAL